MAKVQKTDRFGKFMQFSVLNEPFFYRITVFYRAFYVLLQFLLNKKELTQVNEPIGFIYL